MAGVAGTLVGAQRESLSALTEAVVQREETPAWLLEAARSGDGDAFAGLIRHYQAPVYNLVLRMVRRPATAEDVAQDVFIRLWRHLGEIEAAALLPGWLRRVAVNSVIDHWRKEEARERRMKIFREHPVARYAVRPSSRMESQEVLDTVQAAIDALSPKLRSVLLLRTQEEMTYEEVADVLGMSVHAVRSRLFRARQELHKALTHQKAPEYLARMYQASRENLKPHG